MEENKKLLIKLSKHIQDYILEFEKIHAQEKFIPSDDKSVCLSEAKSFTKLFFRSLDLTIYCCDILQSIDVESKYNLKYLDSVNELIKRVYQKIGRNNECA